MVFFHSYRWLHQGFHAELQNHLPTSYCSSENESHLVVILKEAMESGNTSISEMHLVPVSTDDSATVFETKNGSFQNV